jgi:class 3 adenylate cyclase
VEEPGGLITSLDLKADDYLTKPFNEAALIARIEVCLERKRLRDLEVDRLDRLEKEKSRSDELLRAILPNSIAEELKATDNVKARRYKNVAVLFADVVDFVDYCDGHEPDEVVAHLQEMVSAFEKLAEKHGLQKIKTIGDCFLATAGLLEPVERPEENCVRCGLEMIRVAQSLAPGWNLRVGIHRGELTAGILGRRQFQFDIYGDTVNMAARVEKLGRAGAVNLSADAWKQVSEQFQGQSMGVFTVKGKGAFEIFQITA